MFRRLPHSLFLSVTFATTIGAAASSAAEWGYDDGKKPAGQAQQPENGQALKAAPAQSLFARTAKKPALTPAKAPGTHAAAKAPVKPASVSDGNSTQAITDWIELYDLASK